MPTDKSKKIRFVYIIDKEFQFRFLAHFFVLLVLGVSITLGLLYYINLHKYDGGAVFRLSQEAETVYYKVESDDPDDPAPKFVARQRYLPDYDHGLNLYTIQMNGILALSASFLILITIFGIFKSHKMAGPIYNIKRTLQRMAQGEEIHTIKTRKGDEFKILVDSINELIEKRLQPKSGESTKK